MPPLLVVLGETASGKTALAIELAKRFNGEIISADSRTVYKGMDIGTAKPTVEDRQGIVHYGFDLIEPSERFSAKQFQELANKSITKIVKKGKLPIIVGGTGLYIDAVLYNFQFRPIPNPTLRAELQQLDVEMLRQRVLGIGLTLPLNDKNPRHLMRLLESGYSSKQVRVVRENTLVLGLSANREVLQSRIHDRVDRMVEEGLISETQKLRERYGDVEALRTPGYKAIGMYLDGIIDLGEAKRLFVQNDLHLAKRQRTWFRHNSTVQWLSGNDTLIQAINYTKQFLETY